MVSPINNFDPLNGRWGAFEIAGRASQADIDGVRSSAASPARNQPTTGANAYTGGVNWYLNNAFRFQFNYERTEFDGKPTFAGKAQSHEDVLLTRFQIAY